MKFTKKLCSWFLSLALLMSIVPVGLVTHAEGEDVIFTLGNFQKYDEASHTLLDGTIDSAQPGDVIAVTLSATNNTGSAITLEGFTQHFAFDPNVLAFYPKDETDTAGDGDFSEYGSMVLTNGFTGFSGNGVAGSRDPAPGISNVSLMSTGVKIRANQTANLVLFMYRVLANAPGGATTISLATNEANRYTFSGTVTQGFGEAASITIAGGSAPAAQPHSVTVTTPTNGTVTANPVSAVSGDTVTLTVAPATGYNLATLTVTGASGAVTTTEASATTRTFTMPNEDVTVAATFAQVETPSTGNQDVIFTLGNFQKYDEASHTLLDGTIDSAQPGDVIAVTLSATNNTGSAITLEGFTQHFAFDPNVLAFYPKDETDTAGDGDFSEYGSMVLTNGFTGFSGNGVAGSRDPAPGISNVSLMSTGVKIRANQTANLVLFMYRVLANAPGGATTISLATNEANRYTFIGTVTQGFGEAASITIAGGSAPAAQPHSVTVTASTNGRVTANPTSATNGETVTLTVAPATGYRLATLTVTGATGPVVTTSVNDTTCTFPMPDEDVTVAATFEAIPQPQPQPHNVTVTTPTNGTVTANPTSAASGETVTLTVAPAEGYRLATLTVTGASGAVATTETSATTRTFPMPDEDVTVAATFEAIPQPQPQPHNVTVTTPTNGTVTANPTSAASGETVTLTVAPATGYRLATLTVTGTAAVTPTRVNDTTFRFTMPDEDVTVAATFEAIPQPQPQPHNVTVTTPTNGTVTANPTSAASGETVTLTVAPATGYRLATLTVTGTAAVTPTRVNDTTFRFTMPDEDVTVAATFEAIPQPQPQPHSVTVTASTNGRVTANPTSAAEGETVTLTVAPADGYRLASLTATGVTLTQVSATTRTFTMPNQDVTVAATFEAIPIEAEPHSVTISASSNGTVISSKASAANGESVTLTVTPANGYRLATLTVTGTASVSTTKLNDTTYTFSMPDEAVTVSATFEAQGDTPDTPSNPGGGGCYIATSVYGSYDTPEVWTLRRFRDDVLGQTWYGRLFIKAYYATSPTLVRLFGDAEWFQNFWRDRLDSLVQTLQDDGFEATPYQDKDW